MTFYWLFFCLTVLELFKQLDGLLGELGGEQLVVFWLVLRRLFLKHLGVVSLHQALFREGRLQTENVGFAASLYCFSKFHLSVMLYKFYHRSPALKMGFVKK